MLRTQNLCPLTRGKNIFCFRAAKFVSATDISRVAKLGNICLGNNVSAAMFSSLARPLLDGNTELARVVDVMMTRTKRIYILIIKVNKLFFFFSSRCFLKEIENMFSVFLSSYRKTQENSHSSICVANGKLKTDATLWVCLSKWSDVKRCLDQEFWCQTMIENTHSYFGLTLFID